MNEKIPIGQLNPDPVAANACPEVNQNEVDEVRGNGPSSPLVVRPLGDKYGVLAETEGYLAAEVAGLDRAPCEIRNEVKSDVEAAKISFRRAHEYAPWRTLNAVDLVCEEFHDGVGSGHAGEISGYLSLSEGRVRRILRIRRLPPHVTVCLKNPWCFEDRDWALLSEAGLEKEDVTGITPALCENLAENDDFVELARKDAVAAHEVIETIVAQRAGVREAIRRVEVPKG